MNGNKTLWCKTKVHNLIVSLCNEIQHYNVGITKRRQNESRHHAIYKTKDIVNVFGEQRQQTNQRMN